MRDITGAGVAAITAINGKIRARITGPGIMMASTIGTGTVVMAGKVGAGTVITAEVSDPGSRFMAQRNNGSIRHTDAVFLSK